MSDETYFRYLQNISPRGIWYRNKFVYPLINKWAKGPTLDIGCGIGLYLSTRKDIIGVDINAYCADYCKNQFGDRVKHMYYDLIPFENRRFSAVVLDNVIEHIEDPIPLLTEATRVLKTDGRIIILVPGAKGYKKDPDHKKYYDFNGLFQLSNELNCRVIQKKSIPFSGLSNFLTSFCYFVVLQKS